MNIPVCVGKSKGRKIKGYSTCLILFVLQNQRILQRIFKWCRTNSMILNGISQKTKAVPRYCIFFILKPFIESDIMSDDPKAKERSVMICLIVQQIHSLSFLELFWVEVYLRWVCIDSLFGRGTETFGWFQVWRDAVLWKCNLLIADVWKRSCQLYSTS